MASTLEPALVSIPLQGLPIAAAALDSNTTIVAANQQFERLCGQDYSTGSGLRLTDIVAESDRSAVDAALSDLIRLEAQVPQPRCNIRALRAKPPSLWLSIDVAPLGPDSGVPYVACLQAIGGRRRLDAPPSQRVQIRNADSHRAGSASAAAPVARDSHEWPTVLTTLSHELRGPLTAIRGWTQMAESGALSREQMSRALAVIGRNATSLGGLIERLFDLSRRAAGSLALKRQVIDLNPLAHLVVESTLPAARHREVVLTVRLGRARLNINGDPLRLEQVVRNLVDNAIKFTPSGGHVRVRTRSDGSFAELVVADNGPGIAPDLMPFIFESFRHDDANVQPSERGLGLGLALVRELVRLHDGDVRAVSRGKGHGSTFIVRLPLAS